MTSQPDDAAKKGHGEKRNATSFRKGDGRHRGPRFDPKAAQDIVAAMRMGVTFETAALAAGVRKQTYYNWRRRAKRSDAPPELKKWAEDIRAALARGEIFNVQNIHKAADKGVWQASAWLLERRMPEKYGRREHVEHSGGVDGMPSKIVLHLPGNGRDVDSEGEVIDPTEEPLPTKAAEPEAPEEPKQD